MDVFYATATRFSSDFRVGARDPEVGNRSKTKRKNEIEADSGIKIGIHEKKIPNPTSAASQPACDALASNLPAEKKNLVRVISRPSRTFGRGYNNSPSLDHGLFGS